MRGTLPSARAAASRACAAVHAGRDILADLLIEVEPQLRVEFALDPAAL
jgi:hypothetical protein